MSKIISAKYYSDNAGALQEEYDRIPVERVHADWLGLLPKTKLLILDIGAGSGRDARWFADQGHEVIAIEPADELRIGAQKKSPSAIKWIDDSLPALTKTHQLDYKYDLILLSAVWHHIDPADRERAFRKIIGLLKPSGQLVITLRHGPPQKERVYHECPPEELHLYARRFLLEVLRESKVADVRRPGISWSTFVLRVPDDGTHGLPLLRHIIINDDKSSTYKLALIRSLLRIADGSKGAVLDKNDDHVVIPFGLVALNWVRLFKPLIVNADFRQMPYGKPGFDRRPFREICKKSIFDLNVGERFKGADAHHIILALRDVRNIISKMPAHYITYPGKSRTVFQCHLKPIRIQEAVVLNRDHLVSYGTFVVPRNIWDAMSRYACWIEPAINSEWSRMMIDYDGRKGKKRTLDSCDVALRWLDPKRTTTEVRTLVDEFLSAGKTVYCCWSGNRLSSRYEIDHCFPFSRWPNNDLWNLLPTNKSVHDRKMARLPSAETLDRAKERIIGWWNLAYSSEIYKGRFLYEAQLALPYDPEKNEVEMFASVHSGMELQRIRLKTDQQLQEWDVGLK